MNSIYQDDTPRSQWRSPLSYFLVTSGAVVGLGNLFQFPYHVIEYGGLFFIFFILAELLISIPLMLAELTIGRRGRQNPVGSIGIVSLESGANPNWRKMGWLFFLLSFLSISYYVVSAAFPVDYFSNTIHALYQSNQRPQANSMLDMISTNFVSLEIGFIVFLVGTLAVVNQGIHKGLEVISFIVVPMYFFILLGLVMYVATRGYFSLALHDLISLHSNQPVFPVLMAAITFALFNLNVGMGSMIVYGSYLPYSITIARSTLYIVTFDMIISLLSYFVLHPLLLESHSPLITSLNNHNVINVFASLPGGLWVAAFYFFAAILAAWPPTIAMAEVLVITLAERFNNSRVQVVLKLSMALFIIGTLVTLTQTIWLHKTIGGYPLHNAMSVFTGGIMAPIAAFLVAIYAGWIMKASIFESELRLSTLLNKIWRLLIGFIIPIAILLVALGSVL